jgi:hypothetical protein
MKRNFLLLQLVLITALALASGYPWPDLSQANWDTVLFLTPYGILTNHLDPAQIALKSFYSDISPGQTKLSASATIWMATIYVLMVVNAIWFVARKPKA